MMIVNSIISNKFLATSLCLIGGHELNRISLIVNQLVVKYLRLPIDLLCGQKHDEYTNKFIENSKDFAKKLNISLDRVLGVMLRDLIIVAIREEIVHRFLLETIVLPALFPQFATFSIARTCVSSLLFAAIHLGNPFPNEFLAGQFFHTIPLGVICSLAQQKIGLVGSIFFHAGFNLYAWRYAYNQDLLNVVKKINAIHLIDVIHPTIILHKFIIPFINNVINPARLAFKAIKKTSSWCF